MRDVFGRIVKRTGARDGAHYAVRVGFDDVYPLTLPLQNLAEIWFERAIAALPRKNAYRAGAGVYVLFDDVGGQRVVADLRLAH